SSRKILADKSAWTWRPSVASEDRDGSWHIVPPVYSGGRHEIVSRATVGGAGRGSVGNGYASPPSAHRRARQLPHRAVRAPHADHPSFAVLLAWPPRMEVAEAA